MPEPGVVRGAITIRRPRPADAAAIAATMADPPVARGLMQLPFAAEPFWAERIDAARAGKAEAGLFIVAERDGQVVGNAGVHPDEAARRRHAAHFGIAVGHAHWGTGVGSALLAAICDWADNWTQLLRIELTVFVDNDAAIALYRKFGFVVEGRHVAYALRDGQYVDVLAMARLHPNPPVLVPVSAA
ncbi:MAG: GNAT family N-acetyltransferase [Aquabacterium sp.]